MDLYKDIKMEDLIDEIDISINLVNDLLRYPVWFVHTGKDSDFLRRIDEEDIISLIDKLDKCKYMMKKQQDKINEYETILEQYKTNS